MKRRNVVIVAALAVAIGAVFAQRAREKDRTREGGETVAMTPSGASSASSSVPAIWPPSR